MLLVSRDHCCRLWLLLCFIFFFFFLFFFFFFSPRSPGAPTLGFELQSCAAPPRLRLSFLASFCAVLRCLMLGGLRPRAYASPRCSLSAISVYGHLVVYTPPSGCEKARRWSSGSAYRTHTAICGSPYFRFWRQDEYIEPIGSAVWNLLMEIWIEEGNTSPPHLLGNLRSGRSMRYSIAFFLLSFLSRVTPSTGLIYQYFRRGWLSFLSLSMARDSCPIGTSTAPIPRRSVGPASVKLSLSLQTTSFLMLAGLKTSRSFRIRLQKVKSCRYFPARSVTRHATA